jgi:hypothetical protein
VLFAAAPSAGQASRLAEQFARQHHSAYPGPEVPPLFAQALVATEDHRFYSDPGVDVLAITRVAFATAGGRQDQGGSTIYQQLAKMLYTPGSTGFTAVAEDVMLAVKLRQTYTPDQILRMYAEVAYYGHGYYGLAQASCGYFGHPAPMLTLVQAAMLAGAVNAPTYDDPLTYPKQARARLVHVLQRMLAVGYLTTAQEQRALNTPLGLPAQRGCQGLGVGDFRLELLGGGRLSGRGQEHPAPVAVQPDQGGDPDAEDQRDVERELVVLPVLGRGDGHRASLDQQSDAVEEEKQQPFPAQAVTLAVLERPLPVAEEGEQGGHDRRDDRRGDRSQLGPGVQEVGTAKRDSERDQAHDAELGNLVDQHLEALVQLTNHVDLPEDRTHMRLPGQPSGYLQLREEKHSVFVVPPGYRPLRVRS